MSDIAEEVKATEENTEAIKKIDMKMVTFVLAGKDYGIDIMRVKEISKINKFTYVPNTPPYVRGVYNLRGDIISIIDLRILFNLPAQTIAEDVYENVLILIVDDHYLGVIVDSIDKVVGVSSDNIQPPHPLFGDINIKYINGVIENDNRLYIILDTEKVFSRDAMVEEEESEKAIFNEAPTRGSKPEDVDLSFITETLGTFKKFFVTPINHDWVLRRFSEWKSLKGEKSTDLQLKDEEDAEDYLANFYSPCTGRFWSPEYMNQFDGVLKHLKPEGKFITVWDVGCGKGIEAYTLACILKKKYPEHQIKIWANDNDLLNISMAPGLVVNPAELPEDCQEYLVETKSGMQFSNEIKQMVLFEYHDILNTNPFEHLDLVVARDILSFLKLGNQKKLLNDFWENLKVGGILMLGSNEIVLDQNDWAVIEENNLVAFSKESR